jgi:hypothetical protein
VTSSALVASPFGDHSGITNMRRTASQPLETFMFIKSLAMASVGFALIAAPVAASAASANSATSLSVTKSVRASSPTDKKGEVAGGGLLIIAAAAVAVGGALYLAIDGDDDSDSN